MICIDELGPVRANTYPNEVWTEGLGRATFAPDDGRRGTVWGLGACEPATGLATTLCSPRRNRVSVLQILEQVLQSCPAREWALITDHLSTHVSRATQTALIAWPEVTGWLIPPYACWLKLIEPCWKPRSSLALKGRRFADVDEIIAAVMQATEYWHRHRSPYLWKKAV